MKQLSLGFSPCPNDTFIFDALVHQRIVSEFKFQVILDDVEALNSKAFNTELDITKLSYHAYLHLSESYQMLNAGSALGSGVGPLLITRKGNTAFCEKNIDKITIAIPGEYTTAHFLLKAIYGTALNVKNYLFSDIEQAVLNNEADAGVIIHENRFTYQDKGLEKIADLGEKWEQKTGQLIPLGGIAIKRNLSEETKQEIDRLVKESILFAYKNPEYALPFIKQNAQEMSPTVMQQHIDLYVNDYSVDLGEKGREAIAFLFDYAQKNNIISNYKNPIFVSPQNINV